MHAISFLRPVQGVLPSFVGCLGLLCLTLPVPGDAAALSERQSLELSLNHPALLEWQSGRVDQAHGDLTRAETWDNPTLELSRETLGDETETAVWLRQRLDLSGRRTLQQDAARADLSAMQARVADDRLERAAEIRRQFYQTLYHQQQRQRLDHWVERFSVIESAMRKREAAGDVSGYDRRRISREKVSLLSRQRQSRAEYQAAWQQLAGLLGLAGTQGFDSLQGELLPSPPPPLEAVLQSLASQPTLMQVQRRLEARRHTADALARGHIPDLTLGVGHKRLDALAGSDSGMLLSASVSLPLFDRRQGERQRALAQQRELESESELTRSRLQAQARSLRQLCLELAENARLFREQSLAASQELVRIAQAAYRNNELGVLELIDAYRGALEAELSVLQLELEARNKRIELDRLTGEVLP